MGADPTVEQAKTVLRWLGQKRHQFFTKRDVHQALRGRFKRIEEVEAPLQLLCDRGYIRRRIEDSQRGPGRKPSPGFEVNPVWLDQTVRNSEDSE